MTQRDLNRAIARATGEDIDVIGQMGFVELRGGPYERDTPAVVDWDEVEAERGVSVLPHRVRRSSVSV